MPVMFISSMVTLALASLPLLQAQDRPDLVVGELGDKVNAYLESCESFGFSGVVLVQKEQEIVIRKGYGQARWDLNKPNTPETLYDIASASKQITAAAILLLESRGELDTSASIADYLPNVPKRHRSITVYHLLTHTSGFARNGPAGSGQDMETALQEYFEGDRKSKSGTRFEYYNGGYAMLAAIVERVTGEKFEAWVTGNLFKSHGVNFTDFSETMLMDSDLLVARYNSNKLTTAYIKGWGYRGMGGVITSVADLAIWCNALFGGKILPPAALKKMLTPNKDQYGCGWYILKSKAGRSVIQHGGTAPGSQSYIRYFVEDDLLILVLTNRPGWHRRVAWEIPGLVLGETVETPPLPTIVPLADSRAAEYCGTWEAKGERLFVEQQGVGFSIGGAGLNSNYALTGRKVVKFSGDVPKKSEVVNQGERAMQIITNLRNGDVSLIREAMTAMTPKSWPDSVLNSYWPRHLNRWGEIKDQELMAAYFDSGTGRTHAWVRLVQEKATRSIETTFEGETLMTFDLNAPDFPSLVRMAPLKDGSLTGVDHQTKAPCRLKLRGKGKSRRLELKSRNGTKITFKPVE